MVGIRALITIAALISGAFSDASAAFYDGNNLIPMMQEGEKANRSEKADYLSASRFMGYVTGVADSLGGSICIPESVTISQLGAIVTKYLNEHPDEWHLAGSHLVTKALRVTFPCQQ
ncbi:MAG: Rap1a/Tai family immunity protein [Nitrospirota bacterium]